MVATIDRSMVRRVPLAAVALALMLPGWAAHAAASDQDTRSAREHEMLHRAQEALQDAQRQNADLLKAKTDAESRLKAATDQLNQLGASQRLAQTHSAELQSQLQKLDTSKTDLSNRLDAATQQVANLKSKLNETAAQLTQKDAELVQVNAQLATSRTQNTSCEAKNLKLYELGQTVLQQYQHKGVWSSLMQKEPVTGIKQVEIENFVQEYQDKLDAEKLKTKP